MSSSYKGEDLFGSGPHRFHQGRQGHMVISELQLGTPSPDSIPIGVRELEVIVRGRLVADDEDGLWALRDAVIGVLDAPTQPPVPGELVDLHGRTWAEMSFIDFTEGERVDRGRVVSLSYEATFRRFNQSF